MLAASSSASQPPPTRMAYAHEEVHNAILRKRKLYDREMQVSDHRKAEERDVLTVGKVASDSMKSEECESACNLNWNECHEGCIVQLLAKDEGNPFGDDCGPPVVGEDDMLASIHFQDCRHLRDIVGAIPKHFEIIKVDCSPCKLTFQAVDNSKASMLFLCL